MEAPEYNKTVIVENTKGELFKTQLLELSQGWVKWADEVGQVKKWSYYDDFNRILDDKEDNCPHTKEMLEKMWNVLKRLGYTRNEEFTDDDILEWIKS